MRTKRSLLAFSTTTTFTYSLLFRRTGGFEFDISSFFFLFYHRLVYRADSGVTRGIDIWLNRGGIDLLLFSASRRRASLTLKGLSWLCTPTNSNLHREHTLHVQSRELERVLFRAINCRYITAIRCTCNFCIRLCDRAVINCESQLYQQLLAAGGKQVEI